MSKAMNLALKLKSNIQRSCHRYVCLHQCTALEVVGLPIVQRAQSEPAMNTSDGEGKEND